MSGGAPGGPVGDPWGHTCADRSGGEEVHAGETVTGRPYQGIHLSSVPAEEIRKARAESRPETLQINPLKMI